MRRSQCPITTFQSAVVCSLTGPLQHLNSFFFFSSHSVVDLLVGLIQFQSSFSCWPHGLIFDSRILRCTEEFTIKSIIARCPCPVASKQGWIICPPPPCLMACVKCLC